MCLKNLAGMDGKFNFITFESENKPMHIVMIVSINIVNGLH